MHGAGGGAPIGDKNARKYGLYAAETTQMRRLVGELTMQGRQLAEGV